MSTEHVISEKDILWHTEILTNSIIKSSAILNDHLFYHLLISGDKASFLWAHLWLQSQGSKYFQLRVNMCRSLSCTWKDDMSTFIIQSLPLWSFPLIKPGMQQVLCSSVRNIALRSILETGGFATSFLLRNYCMFYSAITFSRTLQMVFTAFKSLLKCYGLGLWVTVKRYAPALS